MPKKLQFCTEALLVYGGSTVLGVLSGFSCYGCCLRCLMNCYSMFRVGHFVLS